MDDVAGGGRAVHATALDRSPTLSEPVRSAR